MRKNEEMSINVARGLISEVERITWAKVNICFVTFSKGNSDARAIP